MAVPCKGVQEGVGGSIVGLRARAIEPCYGAENDEEVQVIRKGVMKVPCSLDPGSEYALETIESIILEDAILRNN
jgi:hypothetical protein